MGSSSAASSASSPASGNEPAFRHVVLTRFSVRFTADQPPPDEQWLQYRLAFFAEATAASLRSQTVHPDAWLVFCDESAPQWLRDELEQLGEGLFTIVWLDRPWGMGVIQAALAAYCDRDFLITTRLDSDDAIAREFVATVQDQFDRQDEVFVNLLRGLQLDRSGQVFLWDYRENAFISYIERLDGVPQTVFRTFSHGDARKFAPVRNVVTRQPMWLQVVHGSNLANFVRGHRVSPKRADENFSIDLGYTADVSAPRLAAESAASWAKLVAKVPRKPWLARQFVQGKWRYLRGTRTIPKQS